MTVVRYGSHPSQYGELSLPDEPGPWPVAVIIHGGFWRTAYGADLGAELAADLVQHGFAAWNLEYRRVGDDPDRGGGGWPSTCLDVAAAVDLLAADGQTVAAGRLDLSRVIAIGHSAGGHLAGWLAGRGSMPAGAPGASPLVPLTGFLSQAGVLDLGFGMKENTGRGAIRKFLGALSNGPDDDTDTDTDTRLASPCAMLPTGVPSVCVHGTADDDVPLRQSQRFVAAARRAGDDSRLLVLPGADHYSLIDVTSPSWAVCRAAVRELARPRRRPREASLTSLHPSGPHGGAPAGNEADLQADGFVARVDGGEVY
ncbi:MULTISPECIES: alpha/beta hydrolase [Mycobacterium]|uniref:Alpha/beta hydrolase n=1 Tax=Mycobacterium colombiense TaxID=339268 RepID=A0A329M565_9MYCO|nr:MULTISPECIES: alpha/beta hydrolase [Mycobacterium]MDM4141090.1 alpha/beta hydrolase [Mycobacterium sp. FLAC0960]RAV13743.1 alpha/beta hydrolase [Mycobacterium colombiense]